MAADTHAVGVDTTEATAAAADDALGGSGSGSGLRASIMLAVVALLLEHAGRLCAQAQAQAQDGSAAGASATADAGREEAGAAGRAAAIVTRAQQPAPAPQMDQGLLKEALSCLADALALGRLLPAWLMPPEHLSAAPHAGASDPDGSLMRTGRACALEMGMEMEMQMQMETGMECISGCARAALHEQQVQVLKLAMHVELRMQQYDGALAHMQVMQEALAAWAALEEPGHGTGGAAGPGRGLGQVQGSHSHASLLPVDVLLMGMQVRPWPRLHREHTKP